MSKMFLPVLQAWKVFDICDYLKGSLEILGRLIRKFIMMLNVPKFLLLINLFICGALLDVRSYLEKASQNFIKQVLNRTNRV